MGGNRYKDRYVDDAVEENADGDVTVTGDLTVAGTDVVIIANLPTSDPSVAGQLWSNSGVVTVSAG